MTTGRLDLHRSKPPIVLVATEGWNRLTDKALDFALSFSPDVIAVHLTKLEGPDTDQEAQSLRRKWSRDVEQPARDVGLRPPRLIMLQAHYRRIHVPLLELVEHLEAEHPSRTIAVLIPEIVKRRWWENLLHTHRAWRLRNALLRYGGLAARGDKPPWYLDEPKIKEALIPEEAQLQAAERSQP